MKNKIIIGVVILIGVFLVVSNFRKSSQIEKLEIANKFYVDRINEQRNQLAIHNLHRMRLARQNVVLIEANEALTKKDSTTRVELKNIKHKFDALNSGELSIEMIKRFEKEQK